MGRWGEDLFQGDTDLDIAGEISHAAGIELFHYKLDPADVDHEYSGKGLEATREYLNSGTLARLFNEYTSKKSAWFRPKELNLIILGALAMRVGAIISPGDMETVRRSVQKMKVSPKYSNALMDSGFRAPAKIQMETALARYKNDGTPYNFNADRCDASGCGKANEDLAADGNLLRCGKCKETFYCGKDCQAAAWSIHKKVCKTPQQVKAEEDARHAGRAFRMINV